MFCYKQINNVQFFWIWQEIGVGAFSVCKRCVHRSSGKEYAVKVIDKSKRDPSEEVEVIFFLSCFVLFDYSPFIYYFIKSNSYFMCENLLRFCEHGASLLIHEFMNSIIKLSKLLKGFVSLLTLILVQSLCLLKKIL